MTPVSFPAANHLVSPPPGDAAGLEPVPVRSLGNVQTTAWRPTELEIARLNAGALITVSFYTPQPSLVGVGVVCESELELRSAAAG